FLALNLPARMPLRSAAPQPCRRSISLTVASSDHTPGHRGFFNSRAFQELHRRNVQSLEASSVLSLRDSKLYISPSSDCVIETHNHLYRRLIVPRLLHADRERRDRNGE